MIDSKCLINDVKGQRKCYTATQSACYTFVILWHEQIIILNVLKKEKNTSLTLRIIPTSLLLLLLLL